MNRNRTARKKANPKAPTKSLKPDISEPLKPREKVVTQKLDVLQQQIEQLQKQRDALLNQEKAAAIAAINAKIKALNLKPRDLDFGEAERVIIKRAKASPKFKQGSNIWSGRGRQPKWVEDHLAAGGKLDELRVKK